MRQAIRGLDARKGSDGKMMGFEKMFLCNTILDGPKDTLGRADWMTGFQPVAQRGWDIFTFKGDGMNSA